MAAACRSCYGHRAPGAAAPYPPPHPVAQASKPPIVDVDAKVLAADAGSYRFAPGLDLTVTAESGHLFAQLTNQTKLEVFASEADRLLLEAGPTPQADFGPQAAGRPPYVILHQGDRYLLGQRRSELEPVSGSTFDGVAEAGASPFLVHHVGGER